MCYVWVVGNGGFCKDGLKGFQCMWQLLVSEWVPVEQVHVHCEVEATFCWLSISCRKGVHSIIQRRMSIYKMVTL